MAINRPAAIAALKQLLDCCKSAEMVVKHMDRGWCQRFTPVEFREAAVAARLRAAKHLEPLREAQTALRASGFEIPRSTPFPQGKTQPADIAAWLAQGDNIWTIELHLAPTIQVGCGPGEPYMIRESWPSLEAVQMLEKKIRQTICELEPGTSPKAGTKLLVVASALEAHDPDMEARGEWMYDEAMKGTAYGTIRRRLKRKPKKWPRIESDTGIKKAIVAYATRHALPLPAARKAGKPKFKFRTFSSDFFVK